MTPSYLDVELHPDSSIGNKILSVSQVLFDSVKNAPISMRESFPSVLKKNNFALSLRVTKRYAFLEVTTKLKARKEYNSERAEKYKLLFAPQESEQVAMFSISDSRLCRFVNVNVGCSPVFKFGNDFSICLSDMQNHFLLNGKYFHQKVDLLYVVGFGKNIYPESAWQEFDSLIRVTLSDWVSPND